MKRTARTTLAAAVLAVATVLLSSTTATALAPHQLRKQLPAAARALPVRPPLATSVPVICAPASAWPHRMTCTARRLPVHGPVVH